MTNQVKAQGGLPRHTITEAGTGSSQKSMQEKGETEKCTHEILQVRQLHLDVILYFA